MRTLVLALLLVNVGLWGWNAGWLPALLGVAVDGPREPERLSRQIAADAVGVVRDRSPPAVAAPASPASAASDPAD